MSDPITSPTIEGMRAHRSIRAYSSKPVDEAVLRSIMDAVQSMPNWVNCQHVSVVNVADKDLRKQVFEFCNQQPYVLEAPVFLVFCADFYRTWLACHEDQDTFDQVSKVQDNLMVGVTDAGIALGWAVAAAESLGLGTCVIGDARAHGPEMANVLGLPRYVIPIAGLCIGYPAQDPALKPRLPHEAVYFTDRYNPDLKSLIDGYDQRYRAYRSQRTEGQDNESWSETVASFYQVPFKNHLSVPQMLEMQGFNPGLPATDTPLQP
ncbi:NADPH-dependent oxidoreductase [Olsenella sp. KGMB02461]|nr:NADPH-dependent oxidoreductase [Olsenella sp. KGMB02461]